MVLNMIIGSAFQVLRDLRPAIAVDFMVLKDLIVFFHGPFHLLNVRIEMIMPSKKAGYVSFSSLVILHVKMKRPQIKYNRPQNL